MSFVMTCNIILGSFKPVKVHAFTIERSVNAYSDTCKIKMPAIAMMKRKGGDLYDKVETGLQLQEGMAVTVEAGYDGNNVKRFAGFIRRRNFTVPLELECEGYSYLLRKIEGYTKTYNTVTVKQLLQDLVKGTAIKLSESIPVVPLKNIYFRNVKGTDVLDYLKEKCLLNVWFEFDVLHCGLQQVQTLGTKKLRLGWNVIKDDELKFEQNKELATVNIQLENRKADGTKETAAAGKDGAVKKMEVRHIFDKAVLAQIAEDQRKKLVNRGYQGKVTAFLIPYIQPGMAVDIDDPKYTERKGKYFVEAVTTEFGPGGGRQKIKIGASLG